LQKGYDRDVIGLRQLVLGLSMGSVLLVFGLVPGLFQGLTEAVRNYGDRLSGRFPSPSRGPAQFDQPRWLAAIGAALIAVTLLAYVSN